MERRARRVRGSRTGRPIMAVLDLLGRRWLLRILWQLREGPLTFRALREQCDDVSPSVLNTRLGEMRDAGLVETSAEGGYALTAIARELLDVLGPLNAWSARWAAAADGPGGSAGARSAAEGRRGPAGTRA
ncbi:helix-turn-helix transcriptional regulator, partial [Candidatus Binatia bacterium]|nr:helix-turn-helix transcriptional regulator [Candidatus Binatia bacterium]